MAVAATGGIIVLEHGATYLAETTLVLPSGAVLEGNGARWLPSTSLATAREGNPDSRDNALIYVRGAEAAGTLDTTLSSTAKRGVRQVMVAAAGSISAGDWLVLHGHNDSSLDAHNMGSGGSIVLDEILQVASEYTSGSTIPTVHAVAQWHTPTNGGVGASCYVRACDVVSGVTIRNLIMDDAGSGHIAVGILTQFAYEVVIEGCSFSGFSRAGIETHASRQVYVPSALALGRLNSLWLLISTVEYRGGTLRSRDVGQPFHDLGSIRGFVELRNRCADGSIELCDMAGVAFGVFTAGGINTKFGTIRGTNIDSTEAFDRDPEYSACVLHQGPTNVADAEFGYGCSIDRVEASGCTHPDKTDPALPCLVYVHDHWNQVIGRIDVVDLGASGANVRAVRFGDPLATTVGQIHIVGVGEGIYFHNGSHDVRVEEYLFNPAAGEPPSSPVAMVLAHTVSTPGDPGGPSLGTVKIASGVPVAVAADWLTTGPDWDFRIDRLMYSGRTFEGVRYAPSALTVQPVLGDLVHVDEAATPVARTLRAATTTSGVVGVVCGPASGTTNAWHCLYASGPGAEAWVHCVAGRVVNGSLLSVSATALRAEMGDTAPIGRARMGKDAQSSSVLLPVLLLDGGIQETDDTLPPEGPLLLFGDGTVWFAADRGLTVDTGKVSAWADQGQNELQFGVDGAAGLPDYIADDGDGFPAIECGSDMYAIDSTGVSLGVGTGDFLAAALFKSEGTGAAFALSMSSTTQYLWIGQVDGGFVRAATNGVELTASGADGAWHVVTFRRSGNDHYISVDGGAESSATVFTAEALAFDRVHCGIVYSNTTKLIAMAGRVREFVFAFGESYDSADTEALVEDIMSRYESEE